MAKTYGQFCALARGLDHVGDRWTLLIVRELLLGPAGYGELQEALVGIPTNLLADRLQSMAADEIVERETAAHDRRRVNYRLTPLGEALRPAIDALIVWGAHWMATGPDGDRFEPRWAMLAIRALLADRLTSFSGAIEFMFGTESVLVVGAGAPLTSEVSRQEVRASIEGPPPLLLALASGQLPVDDAAQAGVTIRGDHRALHALLN